LVNKIDIFEAYETEVKKLGFFSDRGQRNVLGHLYESSIEWDRFENYRSKLALNLLTKIRTPKGLYIYGGVGRGKTFLMDIFFNHLKVSMKKRVHFYEFMRSVHAELQSLRKKSEPLKTIAEKISKNTKLLCFDEFHISDVATAMILEKLIFYLHSNNVSFIITSNFRPTDLYPDGLNREALLPAIELIKKIMVIKEIPKGVDHRRSRTDKNFLGHSRKYVDFNKHYYFPITEDSSLLLQRHFNRYSNGPAQGQDHINLSGRKIRIVALADRVVWLTFDNICSTMRAQSDYLLLSDIFKVFIIENVPRLTPEYSSAARRFMWLIDILYDRRIVLIVTAEAPADELYVEGPFSSEFSRTASRLIEMQSKSYLKRVL
tara:strand:+ start:32232 stop:33356 length:1125 start_codon:yes stop_codon:yes gene_type:complete